MSRTKIQSQSISDNLRDGWFNPQETWTYESASTFSVAADVTTKYGVGDRIKWTQTTVKYGVITSVGTYSGGKTIITIAVNTDYTITNSTITNNYFSHQLNPFGYPHWFSFTPTYTSLTVVGASAHTGKYCINGRMVTIQFVTAAATSVASTADTTYMNLPFTPASQGLFITLNNSTYATSYGNGVFTNGLTRAYMPAISATAGVTSFGSFQI